METLDNFEKKLNGMAEAIANSNVLLPRVVKNLFLFILSIFTSNIINDDKPNNSPDQYLLFADRANCHADFYDNLNMQSS